MLDSTARTACIRRGVTGLAVGLALVAARPATAQSLADMIEGRLPAVVNVAADADGVARRTPTPSGSPFEEFLRDFVDPQAEPG